MSSYLSLYHNSKQARNNDKQGDVNVEWYLLVETLPSSEDKGGVAAIGSGLYPTTDECHRRQRLIGLDWMFA